MATNSCRPQAECLTSSDTKLHKFNYSFATEEIQNRGGQWPWFETGKYSKDSVKIQKRY